MVEPLVSPLPASERQFRRTAEAIPQIVWAAGMDGACDFVNRRWTAYTGLTADQALGQGWLAPFHPGDRCPCAEAWSAAVRAGRTFEAEHRLRRADGTYRWFSIHAELLLDDDDRPMRWLGTATDIDDRKRTSPGALPEERQRVTLALAAARLGVWEWELASDRVSWSPACLGILGMTEAQLGTLDDFVRQVHPDDAPVVRACVDAARDGGRPCECDLRVVQPEGTVRWVNLRGTVARDGAGGPPRLVGVVWDITERKEEEVRLRACEDRYRLAAEAVQGLIYEYDVRGNVVHRSAGLEGLLGFRPDEVPNDGAWWHGRIHPDDLSRLLGEAATAGDRRRTEYRVRHRDGHWVHVRDHSVIERDAAGAEVRVVGNTTDITAQRLAEASLRESERKFRAIVEEAPVAVAHNPPGERFAYVNRAFCRLVGYTVEELSEKTWQDLTHPDDVATDRALAERVLAGELSHYTLEKRYLRKDGSVVWVNLFGNLIRDDEGRVVYTVGVAVDITEQKQAEQRLAAVLASIDDHLVCYDRQWRFTHVNEAAARVLGRPRGELLGRCIWDLFPEAVGNQYFRELHDAVRDQRVIRSEHYYAPMRRWFENHIYPSPDGVAVFAADVTERKRTEAALREEERRFRGTFDNAAVGIAHVGLDGRWLRVNDRICAITGYSREELLGRTFMDITHADDVEADLVHVKRLIAGETSTYTLEKRYVRPDGSGVPVELTVSLARGDEGEPAYFISVIQDTTERKRIEAERAALLTRLASLVDNTPLAVVECDGDFRVTRWSGEAENLFGWTAAEVLGKHIMRLGLVHEEDVAQVEQVIAQQNDPGNRFVISRNRNRRKGGEVIFCEWYNSTLHDDEGRIQAVLSLVLDVTERRRAEEGLARERERLAIALRAGRLGVYEWRVGEAAVWWSPEVYPVYGVDPGTFTPTVDSLSALVHPDDQQEFWRKTEECIATRQMFLHEYRIVCPDGEVRWVANSSQVATDAAGAVVRITGVATDVTERKRAEQLLSEVIERCPFGIYLVDSRFRLTHVNIGSQEGAFRNVRPVVGRDFAEAIRVLWPEPVAAEIVARFRHTLETGEVYRSSDFVNPRRDIDTVEGYEWELHRVTLPDGRYGVICYYFDSTRLRQAEQALREADRRKDDFLAMLAHELRNPLGPIRNAVQVLNRIGSQDAHARKARDMIGRQVTHMARLVDDLLDVSRVSRGKIQLRREPCDLAAIVRQTAEDLRPTAELNGLRLDVGVSDQPLPVDGDPTRLAQVVGNLLNNAVKFTDPGGRVTVRASAEAATGAAVVTVQDTGIGMEPGVLAHVFEPFTQADRSLDRSRGGLGLGLALVRGLIDLHGGTVAASSEGPGKGSTLTFRLPMTGPVLAGDSPPPVVVPHGTLRVLIVEDNPDAAESLQMLLSLAGHQVEIAADGPAGLARAREWHPQVVLCDIGLPRGMDGYAVARALRAEPGLAPLRLVALTGYGQEDDVRHAYEAGFDHHLVKPAEHAALLAALESAPRGA